MNTKPDLIDIVRDLLEEQPSLQNDHFVSMKVIDTIRDHPPTKDIPVSEKLGLRVIVILDQKSDCLIIPNQHIAESYQEGRITEEQLKAHYEDLIELRLK